MKKRLLVRLVAILAVVALVVASAFSWHPIGVALLTLCVLACGLSASGNRIRDGPIPKRPGWQRRKRAHERSQNYLSEFNTTSIWPDSGNRVQSAYSKESNQFGDRGTAPKGKLKHYDIGYRSRDQPNSWLCMPIGMCGSILGVP